MRKKMLKYLIPAVSTIFLVNITLAADQSSTLKQNIPITKTNDYTYHQVELFKGVYFGISGNYASQTDTSTCYPTYDCNAWNFNLTSLQKPQGYFGSFDVGYNYRFQNNILIGIEANISNSNVSDETSQWSSVYSAYYNSSTNYYNLSTANFKIGYVIEKNLIYAKGGIGFSEISDTFTKTYSSGAIVNSPSGYLNNTSNKIGYAVGGGVEHAFNQNWSTKIEYIKIHFPTNTVDITIPLVGGGTASGYIFDIFRHDVDIIKIGINYSF